MAISPVVLATGGLDRKIKFWDANSGACIRTLSFGETSQVNCLQISTDKKYLVVGGNPQIQIFDLTSADDRYIVNFDGHTGNVTAVGFQRESRWIYSASEDGSVRVWDPHSRTATRVYDCGCPVNSVVLSPNNTVLISGDQEGWLRLWDLEADKCREQLQPSSDPIRCVSIANDASIIAVGCHKGKVFIYSVSRTGDLSLSHEFQAHPEAYLLHCVLSPDCCMLATTSSDQTVRLWNTQTGFCCDRVLAHHQKWVWGAVFSADSLYLVTASSDQTAKLWDLQAGEVIRNYGGGQGGHTLAVTCTALNDSST